MRRQQLAMTIAKNFDGGDRNPVLRINIRLFVPDAAYRRCHNTKALDAGALC
jgi:hypothetical protein